MRLGDVFVSEFGSETTYYVVLSTNLQMSRRNISLQQIAHPERRDERIGPRFMRSVHADETPWVSLTCYQKAVLRSRQQPADPSNTP